MSDEVDVVFAQLLGNFGAQADLKGRAREERKAMMSPTDGRRRKGPAREIQFNPRVTKPVKALIDRICAADKCSQADWIERMAEQDAKARGFL